MSWEPTRIRFVARRVARRGQPGAELLSVYRDYGVIRKRDRVDNFNKPGDDLSQYLVVDPGDLVLNKMKTWQGSLGVSAHHGIVSPAYYVCRLSDRVHGRFLHHLLRSRPMIAEYGARSKGIRSDQWDLPWSEFADIGIRLPLLGDQQRIADFLDREEPAVGRLQERLRCGLARVLELHAASLEEAIGTDRTAPLKHLGYAVQQGWSPDADDRTPTGGEVGVLRLSAVSTGVFMASQAKAAPAVAPEEAAPYSVRKGDLLLVRASGSLGLLGATCFVHEEPREHLMFPDIVYRLAGSNASLPPELVAALLRTSTARRNIEQAKRGAANNKLRIEDVRNLRVPYPERHRVTSLLTILRRQMHHAEALAAAVSAMVDRLADYREALVAEAVAGDLDFTTFADPKRDEPSALLEGATS